MKTLKLIFLNCKLYWMEYDLIAIPYEIEQLNKEREHIKNCICQIRNKIHDIKNGEPTVYYSKD